MSMTDNTYYISWYTWQDQNITTPWDFWFLAQGNRYKPRGTKNQTQQLDQDQIIAAFESGNSAMLDQLDTEYINDVKLVAFVDAADAAQAQLQVKQMFEDAEFEKIEAVDQSTKTAILDLINSSLRSTAKKV